MPAPDDSAEQPYRPPQEASASQPPEYGSDQPPEPRGGWPAILGLGIAACVGWVLLFALFGSLGSGLEIFALAAPFLAMAALAIAIRFLYHVPLPEGSVLIAQSLLFGVVGTVIYVPVCIAAGAGTFALAGNAPEAVIFGFMVFSWGGPFLLATAVIALLIRNVVHAKWRRHQAANSETDNRFTNPDHVPGQDPAGPSASREKAE